MKKLAFLLSIIFILSAIFTSCADVKTTSDTTETTSGTSKTTSYECLPDLNYDEVYAYWTIAKMREDEELEKNKEETDLLDYLSEDRLSFENYQLYQIHVTYYRNEKYERYGAQDISIKWNIYRDNPAGYKIDTYSKSAYLTLKYRDNDENFAYDYVDHAQKRSGEKENYFHSTSIHNVYYYVISSNMVIKMSIDIDAPEQDKIVEQTDAYADHLRSIFPQKSK